MLDILNMRERGVKVGKSLTVQLQQNAGVAHGSVFTLSQYI
jgi:hypothetical protein